MELNKYVHDDASLNSGTTSSLREVDERQYCDNIKLSEDSPVPKKLSENNLNVKNACESEKCGDLVESSTSNISAMKVKEGNLESVNTVFREFVCCLCNLNIKSTSGQGELLEFETTNLSADDETAIASTEQSFPSNQELIRSKKINDCLDTLDLSNIGHPKPLSLTSLLYRKSFFVHRMCLKWSLGIRKNLNGGLENVEEIVRLGLKQKCCFCDRYGASLGCKMRCEKIFHLPCASAAGCFKIIESYTVFCNDHQELVPLICNGLNIECRICCSSGEISQLISCSTCGDFYHVSCVGAVDLPGTRFGWNCSQCRRCQICQISTENESRTLSCEQCQKVYHPTCIRPIITSVPKLRWKCNYCRVCSDCGSRTPGAGISSRWHCNYSVCDSCYQQRNKGFSCPVCHKAYRAAAFKEMVKCSLCQRFVHSYCDNEADINEYHSKKEHCPEYDYLCPACKIVSTSGEKIIVASQDLSLLNKGKMSAMSECFPILEGSCSEQSDFSIDTAVLKDRSFEIAKFSRKRNAYKEVNRTRGGKFAFPKLGNVQQLSRKRSVRGRGKSNALFSNRFSDTNTERVENEKEYDFPIDSKLVLCSSKDKFVLNQDICVMCGSLGKDEEGFLIACSQCSQCFHPYCVNVKITKVLLERGWRCLDCTVCEGCGQKNDEARLLLCDECDISFHIYCIDPPLETVPNGNWKCKWCSMCTKCGRNSNQKNVQTMNKLHECGQCISQTFCCICSKSYVKDDLIIQCENCKCWLHCSCDSMFIIDDVVKCNRELFQCKNCRVTEDNTSVIDFDRKPLVTIFASAESLEEFKMERKSEHWIDGVCMSDQGLSLIKSLSSEIKKKRKMRQPNETNRSQDLEVASIETVVLGNTRLESDKTFPEFPPNSDCMKDGKDIEIVKKKRQRNMQKVGIGGFMVRNRALKKDLVQAATHKPDTSKSMQKPFAKRKKIKNKVLESFPPFLQEAFFGSSLLGQNDLSIKKEVVGKDFQQIVRNDGLFEEGLVSISSYTQFQNKDLERQEA